MAKKNPSTEKQSTQNTPRKKPVGSGRKKGSLNKRTLLLKEILSDRGICPAGRLVDLYEECLKEMAKGHEIRDDDGNLIGLKTDKIDWARLAEKCLADLMPYLYPKRQAIGLDTDDPNDTKTLAEFMRKFIGADEK